VHYVTWEQLGVVLLCLLGLLILVARLTGQVLFGKQIGIVVDRARKLQRKQDEIHRELETLRERMQEEMRQMAERVSKIEGQLGR